MGAPRGSGWRGRRVFPVVLLLGCAGALQIVTASPAEGPTIEAAGNFETGYVWRPSTATVGLGGSVSFKNTSTTVPHGVTWTGGPGKPSCSGVPIEQEQTNWSGSCSFAQAGAYTFVCTVHPTEMKGTITVSSTETPPGSPPPPGGSTESPLQGPASQALKIAKSQQGTSVRGSVDLSQASAGGKLEVVLLAKSASSSAGASAMSKVGRLIRSPLRAGRVSFSVPLKGVGRRALQSQRKLALTVQVVVKPPARTALTLKRGVVLHG
jgi:plastocyanin